MHIVFAQGAFDNGVSKKTAVNVGEIDNRDARGWCLCNVHIYVVSRMHPFQFERKIIKLQSRTSISLL